MKKYFHESIRENPSPRIKHHEENDGKEPYDEYDNEYAGSEKWWDDGPLPEKVVSISNCCLLTFAIRTVVTCLTNLADSCCLMCFETFISGYFSADQWEWAMRALSGEAASAFCPSIPTACQKKNIRCLYISLSEKTFNKYYCSCYTTIDRAQVTLVKLTKQLMDARPRVVQRVVGKWCILTTLT